MLQIFGAFALLWQLVLTDVQAEVVTLPTVEFASPIDYPKKELKAGKGASVLMQLTIDTDGQVLGAEIVESAGDAFDQSAIVQLNVTSSHPLSMKIVSPFWFRFSIVLSSILRCYPL